MGASYRLDLVNESSEATVCCLYQRDPEGRERALPLAWRVARVDPASRVTLSWTADWSFVWGEAGRLRPGTRFRAAEACDADPDDPNRSSVEFDRRGDGYRLEPVRAGAPGGTLAVRSGPGVPYGAGVAVGVAMSGSPVAVEEARTNWVHAFSSRREHWLAAGAFEEGEALDPDGVPDATRIEFPRGVPALTATWGRDRRWTVKPS